MTTAVATRCYPASVSWVMTMLLNLRRGDRSGANWAAAMAEHAISDLLAGKPERPDPRFAPPRPRFLTWRLVKDWGRNQWQLGYFERREWQFLATCDAKSRNGVFDGICYAPEACKSFKGTTGPKVRAEILRHAIDARLAVPWSGKPWNPLREVTA